MYKFVFQMVAQSSYRRKSVEFGEIWGVPKSFGDESSARAPKALGSDVMTMSRSAPKFWRAPKAATSSESGHDFWMCDTPGVVLCVISYLHYTLYLCSLYTIVYIMCKCVYECINECINIYICQMVAQSNYRRKSVEFGGDLGSSEELRS